jgi:uncharacterized protein
MDRLPLVTHSDILDRIAREEALGHVHRVAARAATNDPGHDLQHALRVAVWTVRLLPDGNDPRVAIAAALLHDLVNIAKDSPERARASELSARAAAPILTEAGFAPEEVEAISSAIVDHSFSAGRVPSTDLGRALQDADRLEALGALGIFRTISTGVKMGAEYFDPGDPWAEHRALDDRSYTVDHFFEKLLDLPELMNTAGGRAEAERRATFLRAFLAELSTELER